METSQTKKLYRSGSDRIIGGVASGLAKYFSVDPLVVRILFIIIALVSQIAPAVIAYLLAMIFISREGEEEKKPGEKISDAAQELGERAKSAAQSIKENSSIGDRIKNIFGFFLILIGLIFLINQFFPTYHIGFVYIWPWAIILIGFYLIFKQKKTFTK